MYRRLPAAVAFLAFAAGSLLVFETTPAKAQEKKDEKPAGKADPAKQRTTAIANMKAANLAKTTVVETDNFLIATTFPEEKAKALAAAAEKVVPVARKALQFEEKEEAWKGKLTLYLLPEPRDFKGYMRGVVQRDPSGVFMDLRGDMPFVVDPVEVAGKATDVEHAAAVSVTVSVAMMRARAGTAAVPDWLEGGFARVTAMRAEGTNSARYQKYRTAARLAALGPKGGKPPAVGELWGESKPANGDLLANSLVEYMAYGPGSMNFVRLVFGFRPNENGDTPTSPQALEAAGWKEIPMLEAAWRKWVATGK
jgi:hypothetical protein